MNTPSGRNGVLRWPRWARYGSAALIQAALTAFLLWLYPYYPLGDFPAPYAAALLVTVLVFGEGPAVDGAVAQHGTADVEGNMQPFVQVERQRVGALHAADQMAMVRSQRDERADATVDMHP